jgi:hypothetical protein
MDVCRKDGLIIDLNKSSEELWKINKDDFVNKVNFFALERVKNDKNLLNAINKALDTKETQKVECYLTHDNSGKIKWVSTVILPVDEADLFIVISDDLTHKKKISEEKEALYQDLIYKNHIFESLTIISRVLLECSEPSNLNSVLQTIGETLDVSRAYIFETSPLQNKNNDYILDCKYEWCNANIKRTINDINMHNITFTDLNLKRLQDILLNKQILKVNNIHEELKTEEQRILNLQNIKALLILPIYLPNNQLYGFIGFDECRYYREWKDCEVSILRNISNLTGSFIKKCYYERRLNKFINDQSIILNNLDSYVWFFRDVETYGFINEKYYAEFVEQHTSEHNTTYKDDCLLDDCHIKEESDIQKSTNQHVFDTNEPLIYKQWLTNRSDDKRLLHIKKIPVTNDTDTYIVCIADDITDQYYLEKDMLTSFKYIFEEKTQQIDYNLDQIKQTLEESKDIIDKQLYNVS